jgi:hypothetical protein
MHRRWEADPDRYERDPGMPEDLGTMGRGAWLNY